MLSAVGVTEVILYPETMEISLSVDKGKLWGEMEVPIEIDLASRKDGERKSPGYRV